MCFHRPPLKKLCQEDWANLAEDTSLKHHLLEALRIVRQEIGQLIKLVKVEDIVEESWTLLRAPWTRPGPWDEQFTESPEVHVNALWATALQGDPFCEGFKVQNCNFGVHWAFLLKQWP